MNFRSLSIFKRLRKTSKFFVEWIGRIWNEIELKRMFLFNLKTSFRNFFVFFEFLKSNISIIKIYGKNYKKYLFNNINFQSFLISNNCYSIELNITLFCFCNFLFNDILFHNSFLLDFWHILSKQLHCNEILFTTHSIDLYYFYSIYVSKY